MKYLPIALIVLISSCASTPVCKCSVEPEQKKQTPIYTQIAGK